jgi:predicted transcriptional regulator
MRQRSRLAIITLILESAQNEGGIPKSKLMRNVMLNYPRMSSYCSLLLEKGLLEFSAAGKGYVLTDRGREGLKKCQQLSEYISPVNVMVKRYRLHP